MAAIYTRRALIERVKKHIANGWPTSAFSTTDNEISLYLDSALAQRIVGLAYENFKIEGALAVAEAFQITYALSVPTRNVNTGEYEVAMPQPPLSIPMGYSITNIFFGGTKGKSQPVFQIKAKRVGYRDYLPKPSGISGRIEGSTLILSTSNGQPLNPSVNTLYVTMPSVRVTNMDAPMNIPDDVITFAFDYAVKQLVQRLGLPQDIISDNLPSGNKTS